MLLKIALSFFCIQLEIVEWHLLVYYASKLSTEYVVKIVF